jgi:glycerophosphoryl diester phosphodiesterase
VTTESEESGSPLVIAHRGASRAHPENTLAAFVGAAELGATWVELDVRRTLDEVLIVHHDATLPDGRALAATASGALPDQIPTLAEALDTCASHGLGVNIEIKSDPREPGFDPSYRFVDAVVALVAGRAPAVASAYLVTSFDPACLDRVRVVDPALPTGRLAIDIRDVEHLIATTVEAGHVAVNPWDPFVDETFMRLARAAGLAVYPWTVDDPVRQRQLIDLGVDGIITNVPDVLRGVLDEMS